VVLTVEEAIARANELRPLPSDEAFAALPLVERLELTRHASDREDLRRAVLAGRRVAHWYVVDGRCNQAFTVLGYIKHSGEVAHDPLDVEPAPVEVDERDAGRAGESRTAALQ
jgi:hypothetical protein